MDQSKYLAFAKEQFGGFDNINLLITAFTHRSYLNEHKKTAQEHNERLEFLGDAVLELVVTDHLYRNYDEPEGVLTNWRSALVRTESISAAADRHGFEPLLRLSRGERRGSERARQQILANAYESVVGALYIEKGYDTAKAFIEKSLLPTLAWMIS
jgi:ribonuclease III